MTAIQLLTQIQSQLRLISILLTIIAGSAASITMLIFLHPLIWGKR